MVEDDSVRDARARRAERARVADRKDASQRMLKYVGIGIVAVLVIAGGVYALRFLPKDLDDIHYHASFQVYVDGQEMSYRDCAFDLNGCGGKKGTGFMRGHLHMSDAYQILHIEGEPGLTLKQFFLSVDSRLDNDRLQFDDAMHGGRDVRNNATHEWQLWVNHCTAPDSWAREPGITGFKPTQHDRFLLTFTPKNSTLEMQQPFFDRVPTSDQITSVTRDACGDL